jgi:hypothetical protein
VPKVSPLVVGRDDNLCTSFIPLGWTCSCWRATVKHGRSFQVASTDPLRCCPYCPDHRTSAGTEKQARKIPLNPGANQTFRPPLITKHPLQPCTSRSLPFLLSSLSARLQSPTTLHSPPHPIRTAGQCQRGNVLRFTFPNAEITFAPPPPPLPSPSPTRGAPIPRRGILLAPSPLLLRPQRPPHPTPVERVAWCAAAAREPRPIDGVGGGAPPRGRAAAR